ncbi:hypothetical protein AAG570_005693 [Ranatra chinensis]|uniref:C2 domain-containing protein n=1 Tax=Ranatra chinensis TaxID=642074 RepID=A0ABD0XYJ0_9HEMI
MQTRTYRSSNSPSYKEKFLFGLDLADFSRSWLMFHVYSVQREASTLLGEAQIMLTDVPTKQPITTWLTLADSNQGENNMGEILFSLSYLPTAERLTVVVVKARNLKFPNLNFDTFVKVYLLCNGKKVHKKKTSTKRTDPCPIFNEAMIFSVPCNSLQMLQVRVTVAGTETGRNGGVYNIGHVILGSQSVGKALSHWNQMLASLRKPVAMWHPLRQKPVHQA